MTPGSNNPCELAFIPLFIQTAWKKRLAGKMPGCSMLFLFVVRTAWPDNNSEKLLLPMPSI